MRERANWYILPWPNHTQLQTEALMGSYNQLTEAQRYQIYALKKVGQDQQTIASVLGVSPSTVCREIRRNRGQRGYRAHQATTGRDICASPSKTVDLGAQNESYP